MNNTAASNASQQGVQPPAIDASKFLKDFDDYLMRVQGLALRTRSGYCFWASRFLVRFCAMDAPVWSSLRAEHMTTFVQQEASRLHRYSRAIPGTAIRALLRYLTFWGSFVAVWKQPFRECPDGSTPNFLGICHPLTWNA